MRKVESLNGMWQLYVAPHATVLEKSFSATSGEALAKSGFLCLGGEVPGNFELDLMREGHLPSLFYGTNIMEAQKQENKHLWYVRHFTLSVLPQGEALLRFEGIDTFAEIYLNGHMIGQCENMLIAHEYQATGLRIGENEVLVHITPTAIAARAYHTNILHHGQCYNTDSLFVRKAPYMFGWDIMPRVVSGGIWRDVSLVEKAKSRIEECYLATSAVNLEKNVALLTGYVRLETNEDLLCDFRAVVTGKCGEASFSQTLRFHSVNRHFSLRVASPQLWWPKNAGPQNMYEVEVQLYHGDVLCDTYRTRIGIRTVSLVRTSVVDATEGGKFEFAVNGQRIFVLGSNWVPLDVFPSRHRERLEKALALVEESDCNMLRLWGGNAYECDAFYDWCDAHGVLLWQDFAMGCAYYPQDDAFCKALQQEAVAVVRRLRHHPALVLWAGDNECDEFALGRKQNGQAMDPNANRLTREVLPRVLQSYDGFRPYLPSSPYIDEVAFAVGKRPPEQHLWGPRNFFKSSYYKNADALFASETGFHGCPSPQSLAQYIPTSLLWPPFAESGRPNEAWLAHATSPELADIGPYEYRIGLMCRQVSELFGTGEGEGLVAVRQALGEGENELARFAAASQIFQAEAFKYMIERFRIRRETHGGIIWWNLLDGWPQISDAVVDYGFCKKLAFDFITRAQQPLALMMDEPKENGDAAIVAVNDLFKAKEITYRVTRVSDGALLLSGACTLPPQTATTLSELPVGTAKEAYHICWQGADGKVGENHYFANVKGVNFDTYLALLQKMGFDRFVGFFGYSLQQ